jgi:hypothetical protein
LFPLLAEAELQELGEDIKAHGMTMPVTLWVPGDYEPVGTEADFAEVLLLDGRNRLDACEAVGLAVVDETGKPTDLIPFAYTFEKASTGQILSRKSTDPYEYAVSVNIRRRHLTTVQKHKLIATLLRSKPERSDRQTAELAQVDHKTVSKVRTGLRANGEIPHKERTEASGRKARGRKPILREGAKAAGVSIDKYSQRIAERSDYKTPFSTGLQFYTANPDADLDPVPPTAPLPKSRSLAPPSPPVNGVQPPGKKREAAIAAIVGHLRHDPTFFLSDIAMVMSDEQTRLARVYAQYRDDTPEQS